MARGHRSDAPWPRRPDPLSAGPPDRPIPAGDLLLLDTSTLIAYLGEPSPIRPVATKVVDELVRSGRNVGVVSMISVTEVLVRALRAGPDSAYEPIVEFLTHFPNLRLHEVDFPTAHEAAVLRARHRLSSPDALIVASGLVAGAAHIVTNDREWLEKLRPLAGAVTVHYLETLRFGLR